MAIASVAAGVRVFVLLVAEVFRKLGHQSPLQQSLLKPADKAEFAQKIGRSPVVGKQLV